MTKPALGQVVHFSWTDASGAYVSFTFDLAEEEQWNFESLITKHPVEVGAAITDNVRPNPRMVTLKIVATNEPIDASYWSPASMQSAGPVPLSNAAAVSITPGDGVVDALQWDSQLALRVVAGTAAGLIGGAIGGALGGGNAGSAVGGTLGAVAGSALAGSLLEGRVVDNPVQTNAPSLPGGVAASPINPTVLTFDDEDDFVGRTIQLLETLWATGQTIDVYGSKSACIGPGGASGIGGMGIASLSHSRNHEMGTGASITITLEELRVVSTVTVPAPKPTIATDSKKKVEKGNQGTTPSPFALGKKAGQGDVIVVTH
jgi:hypothetical protein